MKTIRSPKILFNLFTLIIVILVIGFITNNQYKYLYNLIFLYIADVLIFNLNKKETIKTSMFVQLLIAVVIVLHLAVGQYLDMYVSNPYFDKGLHLLGTFTISLFLYQVISSLFDVHLTSKILVFILISSLGIASGVLLEIFEFCLDILSNSDHQKGLVDTNLDIIFNIIGASIAGLIVVAKNKCS